MEEEDRDDDYVFGECSCDCAELLLCAVYVLRH